MKDVILKMARENPQFRKKIIATLLDHDPRMLRDLQESVKDLRTCQDLLLKVSKKYYQFDPKEIDLSQSDLDLDDIEQINGSFIRELEKIADQLQYQVQTINELL